MKRSRRKRSRWFGNWFAKSAPKREKPRSAWSRLSVQPLEERLVMAAELVANINAAASSDPRNLIVVGTDIYFTADDGLVGRELWRSNGSLNNATLVSDIRVGPNSSAPANFVVANNTLYFTADNGLNGRELYAVNSGGQATLIDIAAPAGVGSDPQYLTNVNGNLYFTADDNTSNGRELYMASGASASLISLRAGSAGSFPTGLANVNGDLFFGANDGTTGNELYVIRSNTPTTPTFVADINAGPLGSSISNGAGVVGQYFFYATDGTAIANELYVSDGTSTGTRLVQDINTSTTFVNGQSQVEQITEFNGLAYFSATNLTSGREPRVSNGTFVTTVDGPLSQTGLGIINGDSDPADFTVVEGRLFFSADEEGTNAASLRELYVVTNTGFANVASRIDVNPGTAGSNPDYLVNADGALYFSATDSNGDREIWRSGGTGTNTQLDTNINLAGSSDPTFLAYYNGYVYFSANAGTAGRELYRVPAILPNFAPVLNNTGNPTLPTIAEDDLTNNGVDINTLINSVSPLDMITDSDLGALEGIAITNVDTSRGTWEFSTNGGATWQSMPAVSDSSALLLAANVTTNRIRFVPSQDFYGTVTDAITFRAWDQFKGTNGTTADASINGGSRPFSRDFESASITVTPVGDIPILVSPASPSTTEDVLSVVPIVIAPNGVDGAPISTVQVFRVSNIPVGGTLLTSTSRSVGNNTEITVAEAAAGLRFQAPFNRFGPFTINFEAATGFTPPSTFTGVGPVLSVLINVAPTADLPTVTSASTTEDVITSSGLVVSRNAGDGAEVGFFKITNIVGGTLYQNNGTTVIPNGGFITVAQASAPGLRFRPDPDFNGTATFDIQGATAAADQGLSGAVTVSIPVAAVNDRPVNTAPSPQIARQNTPTIPASFAFTGGAALSVFDVDSGPGSITVQLDVSTGTLSATGSNVSGSPSSSLQIIGNLSQVNAALSTLRFTPNVNFLGAVTLTMLTSDQGNTGIGGTLFDTDTVNITVLADNIAPVLSVPGSQTFNEDTSLAFSTATGNAITISDADSGTRPVTVTLNSTLGVMTISPLGGAAVTGSGSASVTVLGSQASVNSTLNTLVYIPTLNANGTGAIQVSVNDRGNFGFGGPLITNSNIALNITAINDTPVNSAPLSVSTQEDQSIVFTSGNGNQISVSDVDAATGNVTVTLTVLHGIVSVNPVGGVTIPVNFAPSVSVTGSIANVNSALAFVNYRPDAGYTGGDSLTIVTNDQGNTGTGGIRTDVDTMAISILNRNRGPVHTIPGTQTLNEDTSLTFSAGGGNVISVTDADSGAFPISTTVTAVNGVVNLGSTSGLIVTGNGTALITILGTVASVAAALDNMTFVPAANFSGVGTITLATNDQGNSGFGGAQVDTDTLVINILAVNDAPINSVPGDQDGGLNTPLLFNAGNSNLISVSDVDVGFGNMQVDLAVTNGTLTLGSSTGVGVTGDGTSNVSIQGNLASINFVLNNLRFSPNTGFLGNATFTMTSYDSIGGSPLSDTDSFVIRVRDAIEISGNQMFVTGSNIDDIMSLVFTSTTAYTVNINGRQQSADTSTVNEIHFNGGVGNDRLTINDSALASTAVFSPFNVLLTASGYVVDGDTTETIVVNGSAADVATFNDSAGDDTFTATRSYAIMTGVGYTNQVLGFGREIANATTGNDTASLFDGAGNDRFTVYPTVAYFTGPGIDYLANGFDNVFASASTGTDTATFVDSPGNDTYTTRPTYATFEGPGFSQRADGFDQTYAFVAAANVSGTDRAIYYDSSGTDIFYGLQYYTLLYGTGYFHEAVGFDSSVAYSTAGGYDYAVLFDSTANDTVTGSSVQMMVVSPLGMTYTAVGFDQATAFSTFGGTDKAIFNDSAGDDRYYGLITHSALVGPGYFVQAYGFSDVRALGGAGGRDIAILYGSTGSDTLTGAGSSAQVRYQNSRITGVSGFRTVQAIAGKGGVDRRSIAAIDYIMQVYGTWPPG